MDEKNELNQNYPLHTNHPNPFNSQSNIPVEINNPKSEKLEIKVIEFKVLTSDGFSALEDGGLMYNGIPIEIEGKDIVMKNNVYYGTSSLPWYMINILLIDLLKNPMFRHEFKSLVRGLYNYMIS